MHQSLRIIACRSNTAQHVYPFSVHVVTFNFITNLMHLFN